MKLLITNTLLMNRTGSELYVRDIALELRLRGYEVMLYSPRLGPLADTLRGDGFFVTDDLESLPSPPDLIHGQHHVETMSALLSFPGVPAVYFCHGWQPWQETPPLHPRLLNYVGVSQRIITNMSTLHGIAPERTHLLRNFVDLRRFPARSSLPEFPRRALVFSNHAQECNIIPILREACGRHGVSLDAVGLGNGNPCTEPENLLGEYDLVFARGRAALEAMAVGAAVICCDLEGLASLVTPENIEEMRQGNLGAQILVRPVTPNNISEEIARYDAPAAQQVSAHIRETASLTAAVDRMVELYSQTLREWEAMDPPSAQEESRAMVRYLNLSSASAEASHGNQWMLFAERQAKLNADFQKLEVEREQLVFQRDYLTFERDHARFHLEHMKNSRSWKLCVRLTRLAPVRFLHRRFLAESPPPEVEAAPTAPADPLPPIPDSDGPRLACVVMSVGNPHTLSRAVRSVYEQEPTAELLVVNTGGGDAEAALKAAGLDVPVIQREHRLYPGAARNLGLLATRAPFVAFLASDCIAGPGWSGGRIERHLRGEVAVATAVSNASPRNIWAWVSHVLLFALRMPGVPAQTALRYGVSYDRRLFNRYGLFREDLRTGEDTEFNRRFSPNFSLSWAPGVCAAHIHPVTFRGMLADQYARGGRMARVHRALNPALPRRRIAMNAWTRLPRLARTAWRAARAEERRILAAALPFLPLASTAYAAGALFARLPPEQPGPVRLKILAILAFRNEMHHLPDYFRNVTPHVDGMIALDDGSTDGSAEFVQGQESVRELIRIPPRTPHVWDEPENRRRLIEAAWLHDADWLLVLDADERLEENFRERAEVELRNAVREGHGIVRITLRECWDRPEQYRIDGIWGLKRRPRLFRPRRDHQFDDMPLHGTWAPLNPGRDKAYDADLIFYHLGMVTETQRQARRDKYNRLDPQKKCQEIGYDYLADPEGLHVEQAPGGRSFRPMPE